MPIVPQASMTARLVSRQRPRPLAGGLAGHPRWPGKPWWED